MNDDNRKVCGTLIVIELILFALLGSCSNDSSSNSSSSDPSFYYDMRDRYNNIVSYWEGAGY